MIYLESPSVEPSFNLALEEYAFQRLSRKEEYFMLWQNRSAVIIGKHQNAREEVNLPYASEHQIPVVRRLSGGGAVYHDLGNLNFTYIVDGEDPELSMERFAGPLLSACREFGIDARLQGRNDVTVNGRKFSGNARYQEDGRTMHHGTILIRVDSRVMGQVLKVPEDKIASKGVKSVPSRVVNLAECTGMELTVPQFAAVLREKVFGTSHPAQYSWTKEDLACVEELRKKRYDTWEWNYGNFPVYDIEKKKRVEGCGTVRIGMRVLGGCVEALSIRGDFLGSRPVEELEALLCGCPLRTDAVLAKLEAVDLRAYLYGMPPEVFAGILCGTAE